MANLQATVIDGKLTVNTDAVVGKYVDSTLLRKNGSSSSEITHIFAPKGAMYSNSGSTVSGAIKIALPKLSPATMLRMRVEIFDYGKDESVSMWISGYTYSSNGSHLWTNESVQIITSKLEKDFKVRFGNDGSHSCILIGTESQTWAYPKVVVSEVIVGHQNANVTWAEGWSIGTVTSLTGISVGRTINAASLPMAKYARDSNLLDGLNSNQFLRADVSNRLVGNMTIAKDYKIFGEDSSGNDKTMIYMVASNKKTYVGNLDSGTGVVLQGKLGPQYYDGSTYHNILHTGNDDEVVQDIVGKMTTSNTESGITVSYQDSDGTIDFLNTDKGSSQKIFKNVAVSGQSTIVADSNNDTLTFQSGENIVITTDPNSDKLIIRSPLNHAFPNKVTITSPDGMLFSALGEGLEIKNGGTRLGYNDTRLINLKDSNPVMDGALIFTHDQATTSDAATNILELSNGKVASHKNFYAPLMFEGGTQLVNKYLGKTAKAVDSDKLDGVNSSQFARTDIATETFDGGANTTLNVMCDNNGAATLNLMGTDQGTGRLFVGQSVSHGGGIEYNGDNVPVTSGGGADYIVLFRRSSGTNFWTARNSHSSNDWEFRGDIKAASFTEGTVKLSSKYLGKTATAANSLKLGGVDASKFIRSDSSGGMTQDLKFLGGTTGLVWEHDTDGASIKFLSTGDSAVTNRLVFEVNDNGNEWFQWVNDGAEKMSLRGGNLWVDANISMKGGITFRDSVEGDGIIEYTGTGGFRFKSSGTKVGSLDDTGNFNCNGTIESGGNITIHNGSPTLALRDTDHKSAFIHTNGNTLYVLRSSGNNGTTWDSGPNGRHPMTMNLDNGTVTFSGDVAAYSDRTLKCDIKPIENALDKVNSLNGVTYNWINNADDDSRSTGLIAQDVEKVLPEVIARDKDDKMTVAYGNMMGLLVESVKELTSQVNDLKAETNDLKAQLAELKK